MKLTTVALTSHPKTAWQQQPVGRSEDAEGLVETRERRERERENVRKSCATCHSPSCPEQKKERLMTHSRRREATGR
eukprot:1725562-Alexandrium_andersonii.AAC.1